MAPASRMTRTDKCYYMQMILILLMDLLNEQAAFLMTRSLASKSLHLRDQ